MGVKKSDPEFRLRNVSTDPSGELARITEAVTGISLDRFFLARAVGDPLPLTEAQKTRISELVDRRCSGEPLQYLIGSADFYGRSFRVRPGVLIPRFDTEIVVEAALARLSPGDSVLDLCAGSGCIGLTLGAERAAKVTAVEKYPEAFQVLRENAAAIDPDAVLIQGDVLQELPLGPFDLIVSNPPYIPTSDLALLSPEVQREPVTALDGGRDGLDFYRALTARCVPLLSEQGTLLYECGIGQAVALEQLLISAGLKEPFRVRDYGGVERAVGAKKDSGRDSV